MNLSLPIQKMKLIFIPDPKVHSHEVSFPVSFVFSKERSSSGLDLDLASIPQVVVHASTAYGLQLSAGAIYEVKPMIGDCLHVKCREYQDSVVSLAIKAALGEFKPLFLNYGVFAEYSITHQS